MKVLFAALVLASANAFAAPTSTMKADDVSNRAEKPWGVALALGAPHPSLAGITGSYNLNDWSRAEVAYGSVQVTSGWTFDENGMHEEKASIDTLGAGIKFFVPGWNFSPTGGLHVSSLTYSGDGLVEVQGYKKSGVYAYGTVGADWLSADGYSVNFGANIALGGGSGGGYAGVGYFF